MLIVSWIMKVAPLGIFALLTQLVGTQCVGLLKTLASFIFVITGTILVHGLLVLQSVGLPAEAIAILLPIDRLLDAVRTAVNVEGDMIGSLVVQKLTMPD